MEFKDLKAGMFLQTSTPANKMDGLFIYHKSPLYVYFINIFNEPFNKDNDVFQLYWAEWDTSYYKKLFKPSDEPSGVIMALFEREGISEFLAKVIE